MKSLGYVFFVNLSCSLSVIVSACGKGRGSGHVAADHSSDTAKGNAPTDAQIGLARLCGKPALPEKKVLDVKYQKIAGVDPKLQSLDIYMPKVMDPCQGVPVVIFVHGGAWKTGDKSQMQDKPAYFNSLGYAFVSVNYRLSPQDDLLLPNRIMFPVHPTDVGAAVAWVYKNIKSHGGNPERLALLGHSAGAHLAALVGTNQTYIQKAASSWKADALRCVGSYDTEGYDIPKFMETADGQESLLYRNAFGDDPNLWATASPINHVKFKGPHFQLVKRGDAVRDAQVDTFKGALERKSNFVTVIDGQGLSHSDVNHLIGAAGDTRMTPFVTEFMKTKCFPR